MLNLYRVCVYRGDVDLVDYGRSAAEIVEWLGTSRVEVERTLRMLGLTVLYFTEELQAIASPAR